VELAGGGGEGGGRGGVALSNGDTVTFRAEFDTKLAIGVSEGYLTLIDTTLSNANTTPPPTIFTLHLAATATIPPPQPFKTPSGTTPNAVVNRGGGGGGGSAGVGLFGSLAGAAISVMQSQAGL
jgi:hypothetical protein